MTPGSFLIILAVAVVFAVIGERLGKRKGRAGAGWWLGFFLGIIGLVILACLPADEDAMLRRRAGQIAFEEEARRMARGERD